MRKIFWIILAALLMGLASAASAQEGVRPNAIRGGQLYDNWFVTLGTLPPEGDHPLWKSQNNNQRSGTVTWRCVTCHGWDYKGADGALDNRSPNYTGFPGTMAAVNFPFETIAGWLDGTKDPDHDFSDLIDRESLGDLIAFLRTKQLDLALILDYQTKASLGHRNDGQYLFIQECMICHGLDGSALNFRDAKNPEFIADVALYDPWRFTHKVRFGGAFAAGHDFELLNWSLQNLSDLLAFSQTLPTGGSDPFLAVTPGGENPQMDVADQGNLDPVVITAFSIVAIIFVGLAWSHFTHR